MLFRSVGVSPPEVVGADFNAAQEDRSLVVEHDSRSARLLVPQEVLADVLVRDDLGHLDEGLVAACVVRVVVVLVARLPITGWGLFLKIDRVISARNKHYVTTA